MAKLVLAAAQSSSKRGDIKVNVENHLRHINAASDHGAQFIFFPELSLTGYEPDIAETHSLTPIDQRLNRIQATADKRKITVLAGAPYKTDIGIHISAFLYEPNQKPRVYTNHYLHAGEDKHFTSGTMDLSFSIGRDVVAPAICADIAHPEHAENAAGIGASVYAAGVMITPKGYDNDAGLLRGYAERYGMLVLLSNYASETGGYPSAGRSAAWDNYGNLLVEASDQGEAVVLVKIDDDVSGEVLVL